ncbi:TonB-dependent receptor [Winogradskyella psychrotolerans RS-3]|uniref:TonB-dependent receptor n=1 Tax=Winogradskyella psychrotolerans RS-3 TaxID=641526 RepID=S7VR25_9FLAO|nr:carboxypeptidase-like regulatory domain-containing protein [Winogradskyella psychrotolerans]EPR72665.1 TonB-dependent receptor [Winogradskyella psychrotolerans RS-3]
MKRITILIIALCFTVTSIAQILVTGVVSNDSITLESASILIKNSTKGIATNNKGQFKIEANPGDTLSVSYIGYESKEIVLNKDKHLEIELIEGGKLKAAVVNGFLNGRKSICRAVCYSETRCGVGIETSVNYKLLSNQVRPKLFPNPSSNGVFQLNLNEDYNEVKISIANISGQIIQNLTHQKIRENVRIDLSQLTIGIYIINIIADGKQLEFIKAIRS